MSHQYQFSHWRKFYNISTFGFQTNISQDNKNSILNLFLPIPMQPAQLGQGGNNENCFTMISTWWTAVPFSTKTVFIAVTVLLALDLLTSIPTMIFMDVPIFVLGGQIQRLFFTHLVHGGSFMNVIFCLLSFYFTAVQLEKTIGSVTFLLDLFMKNFLIQVIFCLICILLSPLSKNFLMEYSMGLWNIVMVYITIRSFSSPDQDTQFLCFPVTIKNVYYPFGIFVFVCIFSQKLCLDLLAAILLGLIEHRWFSGMMMRPSKQKVERLEFSIVFRSFKGRADFVTSNNSVAQFFGAQQPQQQQQQPPAEQEFREFAGRGVRLGGNPVAATNVVPLYNGPNQNDQLEDHEIDTQTSENKKKKNYNQFAEDKV